MSEQPQGHRQDEQKVVNNHRPDNNHNAAAVEMSNLASSAAVPTTAYTSGLNDVSIPSSDLMDSASPASNEKSSKSNDDGPSTNMDPTAMAAPPMTSATDPTATYASETTPAPELSRLESIAIGPSTDTSPVIPVTGDGSNPVCIITLLLTSGARHPYKLDERYLAKRNVEVPGLTDTGKKDPFSISVYTLKELILREWREEWEAKPSSPSSIRLIHFGRLLDDKTPLKECRFNADAPNVVHMTVKPQDIVDEEDAVKGRSGTREREGNESTPGCRCIIM